MAIHIPCPDHISLANRPTPLQKMERLSKAFGVDIFFKRDDMTGSELSGNKVRKLEFLIADALKKGADTVVTCGGAQSNHCRATALAAVRSGLKATLILRTDNPKEPPPTEGNILLDCLVGAELVWVTPDQYRNRETMFQDQAKRLVSEGKVPYLIPEGGSTPLGAWGYVLALEEIVSDLSRIGLNDVESTTVISAMGSGGTSAGLILGAKLLKTGLDVAGINVCDNRQYFEEVVKGICTGFINEYPCDLLPDVHTSLKIVDGYVGKGYALSSAKELQAIHDLARMEGVVLDPVYTGKAYYGMIRELEKDRYRFGKRIVFVHTGGLFGLFPVAGQFEDQVFKKSGC